MLNGETELCLKLTGGLNRHKCVCSGVTTALVRWYSTDVWTLCSRSGVLALEMTNRPSLQERTIYMQLPQTTVISELEQYHDLCKAIWYKTRITPHYDTNVSSFLHEKSAHWIMHCNRVASKIAWRYSYFLWFIVKEVTCNKTFCSNHQK
jgi:hypothetical protein